MPCVNFEDNFKNQIKLNVITSKDTLSILDSFLQKVRYTNKTNDIDVRAKFIYHKGDGTTCKICMSKFYIQVDDRQIKYNKDLFAFLKGLATQ